MIRILAEADDRCELPPIVEASVRIIRNIATLPSVALKILKLVEEPDTRAQDIQKVVTSDLALSTRVLRVVNSAFYGVPRQVASVNHAVLLLGPDVVKNIAIAASLHKVFQSNAIPDVFGARDLWMHCVAVATAARGLAGKSGRILPDEAFLAGLIHDVGIMVEMQACYPQFVEITDLLSQDSNLTLRQAELQILGATHEAFGAGLCRQWRFPVHLEYVAGYHHRPTELTDANQMLPAIIQVADILARQLGVGLPGRAEAETVDAQLLQLLHLTELDIEAVAESLPAAIEEAHRLLSD